ncbi:hypothetical protein FC40_GL000852 [Ligilactobacillus hayakitensis DSM 18933 = JCM 14209]|uniref:Na+-translocating membrane potential-generating system MpsC domain-containing protein n=1 Tax=Ligilactobacillus hayakitensis DSM 18933 = JCM 14209 TaxID=1423755 RepID=A0A0R1WMH4_9LACO|nr:hypothetical protein FC40_GL000852 [Ligilactobacillus hayakitensis DSM 18933 = JCM 14209]
MIYNRKKRINKLKEIQQKCHHLTKDALRVAIGNIEDKFDFLDEKTKVMDEAVISDVWGQEIMVFEYKVCLNSKNEITLNNISRFKKEVEKQLEEYVKQKELTNSSNKEPFVISDIWQMNDNIHLDIAYIMNDATINYLEDINKVEKTRD